MTVQEQGRFKRTGAETAIVLLICAVIAFAFARILVPGWDLVKYFKPVPRLWLDGDTRLYDSGVPTGFPYPPWFLLFILPLAWVSLRVGQLAIFVVSIWSVYASIGIFTQRRERPDLTPMIFMIGNLHFIHLLYLGQVDGLILIGLGWGWLAIRHRSPALFAAALVITSTKPVNVALAVLLLLGYVLRHWSWREQVIAVWGPGAALLVAGALISGVDWPVRYLDHLGQEGKPGIMRLSLWALGLPGLLVALVCVFLVAALAWAVWRQGITRWTFSLALATNMLVSPYVMGYHFVLLAPAFLHIWQRDKRLAVGLWLLTFTVLLRAGGGAFDRAALDALYPAALLVALWWGPELRACLDRDHGLQKRLKSVIPKSEITFPDDFKDTGISEK